MQDQTRSLNLEMENIQNKVRMLEYYLSESNFDEVARLEKEINICLSRFGNLANNVETFISVSGLEINVADARDESEADNPGVLLEDERIKLSFIRFVYIHIET